MVPAQRVCPNKDYTLGGFRGDSLILTCCSRGHATTATNNRRTPKSKALLLIRVQRKREDDVVPGILREINANRLPTPRCSDRTSEQDNIFRSLSGPTNLDLKRDGIVFNCTESEIQRLLASP